MAVQDTTSGDAQTEFGHARMQPPLVRCAFCQEIPSLHQTNYQTNPRHTFFTVQATNSRPIKIKIMLTRNPGALAIRLLTLVALIATLSSFLSSPGMESFKVYLNDQLLFEQYVTRDAAVQTVSLKESPGNDLLTVYYDHCGRIGSQRTLMLLDGEKVLRKWDYPDTQVVASSGMACRVSDIKALQKPGKAISLVYASQEVRSPIRLFTFSSPATHVKAGR